MHRCLFIQGIDAFLYKVHLAQALCCVSQGSSVVRLQHLALSAPMRSAIIITASSPCCMHCGHLQCKLMMMVVAFVQHAAPQMRPRWLRTWLTEEPMEWSRKQIRIRPGLSFQKAAPLIHRESDDLARLKV